jgi:AcrR family transcriptional regulator
VTDAQPAPLPRVRRDRQQVLAAACGLADASGLEATTLSAVARALGIRTPSLYRHVESHAALIEGIATTALSELADTLRAAAAGRSGPDAARAVAHAYRRYAHEHPGRYAATTALAAGAGHDAFRAAASSVLTVLQATLRAWELTDAEEIDVIRGFRAALHGFVTLERIGGFALTRPPDASFAVLVDTLVAGLGAAATR